MYRLGAAVVLGGLLLGTVSAHAAPLAPTAAPSPTPTTTTRFVLPTPPGAPEVEVVPVSTKCGDFKKTQLKFTNKTAKEWKGVISYVAPTETVMPVTLAASGGGAVKTVDVKGGMLDCKKPLTPQNLRVFKEGAPATPVLLKILQARVVKGSGAPPRPPTTELKPYITNVKLLGTCGETPAVTGTVMSLEKTNTQQVKLKLGFGIYQTTQVVVVAPNTSPVMGLPVPVPLDCQAAAGIPAVDYQLFYGVDATGKIEAQEVSFE